MDSQALKARIADAYASGDFEALTQIMDEMVGDDFVLEYPQSGERFRGWDRIKEMNQSYEGSTGTNPKMTGRSILEPGKAWVFESTIDYGDGTPVSAVTIIEVALKNAPMAACAGRTPMSENGIAAMISSGVVNDWNQPTTST